MMIGVIIRGVVGAWHSGGEPERAHSEPPLLDKARTCEYKKRAVFRKRADNITLSLSY